MFSIMTRMQIASTFVIGAVAFVGAAVAAPAREPPLQGEAARGRKLFMDYGCYQCHGTVGQGGGAGPRLAPNPRPAAQIIAIVRRPIKEMPPYNQKVLGDADVTAIHAYLSTVKAPPAIETLSDYFRPGTGHAAR